MKYLLLGYGKSAKSIEKYFLLKQIEYQIYDDQYPSLSNQDLKDIQIIVKSGGISNDHLVLKEAKKRNLPIVSDLELFSLFFPLTSNITVTGSNGKTTTVRYIETLLPNFSLVGNVGIPIFDFFKEPNHLIIEASSFMLEYTHHFHSPCVVLLNVYKTHQEHHHTMNQYIKSKLKVLSNSKEEDIIIYYADDPILSKLVSYYPGVKVPFSLHKLNQGIYIDQYQIYEDHQSLFSLDLVKNREKHNLLNLLASIAVARKFQHVSLDILKDRIKELKNIEHRLEYIGKINHVDIYNDAKSTNFFSLKTALTTFPMDKILLIVGGKKREDDQELLKQEMNHIELVYSYGEMKDSFYALFSSYSIQTIKKETLEEVLLDIASKWEDYEKKISVLLYSPGTQSYDQYKHFEERGNEFKSLCQKLLSLGQSQSPKQY